MSLYKQLWLATIALLAVVFCVSLLVTTLSARNYLEEQLAIKNSDNATALALSLSQQGADEILMELTLSAQFDTGYYALIELTDPEGNAVLRRTDDLPAEGAPQWFAALFPIEVEPGIGQVQAGWQQAGTLLLQSHSRFAYEELWQNTLWLAGIFLLAALLAGALGNALLRRILQPLDQVVNQAEAIRQRRFVTIDEPATLEFRQLVGAMNGLSAHVKSTLAQEAKRLQKWQLAARVDQVTGLANREPFLGEMEAMLKSNDSNAAGSLCLVRVSELSRLNLRFGRQATDALLHEIGNALNRIVVKESGWSACRLNGSDFAVLAPRELEPKSIGKRVQSTIGTVVKDHAMQTKSGLPAAVTVYEHGDTPSTLLTRLDGALIAAMGEGADILTVAYAGDVPVKPVQQQMQEWQKVLGNALQQGQFSLARFPTIDREGGLIHHEAPARLERDGRTLSAGQFLPWVNRLQLSAELDRAIVGLALQAIERDGQPVAVNLTLASVADGGFLSWLEEQLTVHHKQAPSLWLEVPEPLVFRHLDNFKRLCNRAKLHGAHVGMEHMGHQLAELGQLHDVGLDYLKVDASFVRNLQDNPGNQTLLRTLCTLGHSIGVIMIAEGVESDAEWEALKEVGMDGATGPGISL